MTEKTKTDINRLISDYVELAYHSVLVKEPEFECTIELQLDKTIPQVAVHPQNISRVILNLMGNALYAVGKKQSSTKDFQSLIKAQSKLVGDIIQIQIEDNGEGISENEMEKIFQPFFTTKPVGEGTGLGLSLSYDIITKEHAGSMTVASKKGMGTTFTIRIPLEQ
jgi:signal transduction histidine kinase